jgi:hypothetical protein
MDDKQHPVSGQLQRENFRARQMPARSAASIVQKPVLYLEKYSVQPKLVILLSCMAMSVFVVFARL